MPSRRFIEKVQGAQESRVLKPCLCHGVMDGARIRCAKLPRTFHHTRTTRHPVRSAALARPPPNLWVSQQAESGHPARRCNSHCEKPRLGSEHRLFEDATGSKLPSTNTSHAFLLMKFFPESAQPVLVMMPPCNEF